MEFLMAVWTGVVAVAAAVYWFVWVINAVDLKMGTISHNNVKDKYTQYLSFFSKPKETAATASSAEKVPAIVDIFYNLVTDMYEWGWGQSFHNSPSIPGHSRREECRIHQERVADLITARPGHRILDIGCGVGGPMRAIAAYSGSQIVGITNTEYQVTRARAHNKKAGLDSQCEVICGDFLKMPFQNDSFDGAYSIEATCHAPCLEEVYAEVFRVLKPGGLYVSYDSVTTPLYQAENQEHVKTIQGIERGGALPGLRAQKDIAPIAKSVGFEVVQEKDLALPPAGPWWTRLKMGRIAYWRNRFLIFVHTALCTAPKGVFEVHEMLYEGTSNQAYGGKTGIYTPMYMILCRKPVKASEEEN